MEIEPITCCDCLEWLRAMPDGCADLVLTDPPYNIGKAAWDNVENYVGWLCDVFDECHRVAKDNATLIWWHKDMPQIAAIMCELERRGRWKYNCHIIARKDVFNDHCWRVASKKNTLRKWYDVTETAFVYVNEKALSLQTGTQCIHSDPEFSSDIRAYFWHELERCGLDESAVTELYKAWSGECGSMMGHYLHRAQFEIPTRKKYEGFFQAELRRVSGIPDLFPIPYDGNDSLRGKFCSLVGKFEDKRVEFEGLREVHNLDPMHCNVWEWHGVNDSKLHPCRKSVDLLRRLVRVHSNPGALVLDPFAGSGSTGEAAIAERRRFAGCEREARYAEIARRRIASVVPDFEGFQDLLADASSRAGGDGGV